MNPFAGWANNPPKPDDRFELILCFKSGYTISTGRTSSPIDCINMWNNYMSGIAGQHNGKLLKSYSLTKIVSGAFKPPELKPHLPSLWKRIKERVSVQFCWYDVWVGVYYNRLFKTIYVCPLPCCVVGITLK